MYTQSMKLSNARANLGIIVLALSLLLLQAEIGRSRSWIINSGQNLELAGFSWDAQQFSALSGEALPAALDFIWISSLQNQQVSTHKIWPPGVHPAIYYDLNLLSDLDATGFTWYSTGGNILTVLNNDHTGALSLLEKGERFRTQKLSSFPDSFQTTVWKEAWLIPFLQGYIELYGNQNLPQAADRFHTAAAIPGAPLYLRQLDSDLAAPIGFYKVGLRIITLLIHQSKDALSRAKLIDNRTALEVSRFLTELNSRFSEFLHGSNGNQANQWHLFRQKNRIPELDPWGGKLSLNPSTGKILTSTSHSRVFGLE